MKKILSILTVFALLVTSCSKQTTGPDELGEGEAKVRVNIAGTTNKQEPGGDEEPGLQSSTKRKSRVSAPAVQSVEIPFNGSYRVQATLTPVGANSPSLSLRSSNRAAAISGDPEIQPLPEGTKYVVAVYDATGVYVDHGEYTHGSGNTPQELSLTPGTYTFIAVSSGSNTLPEIDYEANLSTISFTDVAADVDLMYQKQEVEVTSGNNNVAFVMEYLFTQVVVTLNSLEQFGDILSINGGTVAPHQPAAVVSLADGSVTLSGTVGEREFTFPNDASGLSWTSNPVMILNQTTETGTVVLKDVTINQTTRNLIFNDLNIRAGVKYVLTLDLKTSAGGGEMTDIDGNVYSTVVINGVEWMAENLKATRYRNGDPIPTEISATDWATLTSGAYAVFPYTETSGAVSSEAEMIAQYGLLYNGYAVMDERGLAPEGWRVATDEDYKALERFAGMSQEDSDNTGNRGNIAAKLRSTSWSSGTDDYGFAALPAGFRRANTGEYVSFAQNHFWTSTPNAAGNNLYRRQIMAGPGINRGLIPIGTGFSVRCVRDL